MWHVATTELPPVCYLDTISDNGIEEYLTQVCSLATGAAKSGVEELPHDGLQEKCEDDNREHTQTSTPHKGGEAESSGSMVTERISTPDAKKNGDESTMNCGGGRDDKERKAKRRGR